MMDRIKVLFLCTGNACRSQMAEALLKHLGQGRFDAHSAGSHPAGYLHPLATETLTAMHVGFADQYSKSWDVYAGTEFSAIITLCDAAASEPCPTWPGTPVRAHWSTPDPVALHGSDEERSRQARQVAEHLRSRIKALVALDVVSLSADRLRDTLERSGQS